MDAPDRHANLIKTRMALPVHSEAIGQLLLRACPPLETMSGQLSALLARLLDSGLMRGGVVEHHRPGQGWVVVSAGASVFVDDDLAQALRQATQPYATAHLFGRFLAGEHGLFLDDDAIARGNSGDGLNLFVLGFANADIDSGLLLRNVLACAIEHFVQAHRGFRLKRIIREDPEPVAGILVSSGMREIRRFSADGSMLPADRVLMEREATDEFPLFPDSITAQLFAYAPPIIHFPPSEKRMLDLALHGLSDEDLASELGLSINTIKGMWKTIYARTARRAPAIVDMDGDIRSRQGQAVRGSEKRRHLLAYLREHLQELRPHLPG